MTELPHRLERWNDRLLLDEIVFFRMIFITLTELKKNGNKEQDTAWLLLWWSNGGLLLVFDCKVSNIRRSNDGRQHFKTSLKRYTRAKSP